jgi:hypothetical protein
MANDLTFKDKFRSRRPRLAVSQFKLFKEQLSQFRTDELMSGREDLAQRKCGYDIEWSLDITRNMIFMLV